MKTSFPILAKLLVLASTTLVASVATAKPSGLGQAFQSRSTRQSGNNGGLNNQVRSQPKLPNSFVPLNGRNVLVKEHSTSKGPFNVPLSPLNPVKPTGPTKPTKPIGPLNPIGPIVPVGPIGPVKPPKNPGPIGPIGPIGPVKPPKNPGPIGPIGPIGPVKPPKDPGPIGPIGPINPPTTPPQNPPHDNKCHPHFWHPWFCGGGWNYPCYGNVVTTYSSTPTVIEQPVVVQPVVIQLGAAEPALTKVPVGTTITLNGNNFGTDAGRVGVALGELLLAAEASGWTNETVKVAVPQLALIAPVKAKFVVFRADGSVASEVPCELVLATAK